jgi:hypothetical protein
MGYVSYVGRVGALAVALGVGTAVATMPGVALAQPLDSSSSSSSSPSGSAGSLTSSSTDKSGRPSIATASSGSSGSSSTTATGSSSSANSSATPDPRTGVAKSPDSTQTGSTASKNAPDAVSPGDLSPASSAASSAPDQPPISVPAPTRTAPPSPKASSRSAALPASASPTPQRSPRSSASKLQSPNALRLTNTTSSPDLRTFTSAAAAAASSPVALAAATRTEIVAPQAVRAPFSGPLAPLNIVTSVVSTVLGWVGLNPSMTNGPVAPVQTPVLWTLLAWVRSEIGQSLSNGTAAAGVQHTGVVNVEAPGPVVGPNLLLNPGAELGDPSLSGYSTVTVPGWTVTGTPTVIEYGTSAVFRCHSGRRDQRCQPSSHFRACTANHRAADSSSSAADPWRLPRSPKPSTSAVRRMRSTTATCPTR